MTDKMKLLLLAGGGIAAAALLLITAIFSGGDASTGTIDDIPDDEQVWVKCTNPDCGAAYRTGKKAFYRKVAETVRSNPREITGLTCEKCGRETLQEAIECAKCGTVFAKGAVPGDYADRCPKCGFSSIEQEMKERKNRTE